MAPPGEIQVCAGRPGRGRRWSTVPIEGEGDQSCRTCIAIAHGLPTRTRGKFRLTVIVVPGGGHRELWTDHEGHNHARFSTSTASRRCTSVSVGAPDSPTPSKATPRRPEQSIRSCDGGFARLQHPDKIGVMGFSADGCSPRSRNALRSRCAKVRGLTQGHELASDSSRWSLRACGPAFKITPDAARCGCCASRGPRIAASHIYAQAVPATRQRVPVIAEHLGQCSAGIRRLVRGNTMKKICLAGAGCCVHRARVFAAAAGHGPIAGHAHLRAHRAGRGRPAHVLHRAQWRAGVRGVGAARAARRRRCLERRRAPGVAAQRRPGAQAGRDQGGRSARPVQRDHASMSCRARAPCGR